MNKSVNMEYINECISDLDFDDVKSQSNKRLLETIKRFLNREFGSISNCISIEIANNSTSQIYGMQVLPSLTNISELSKTLAVYNELAEKDLFTKVTDYTIEIDSKICSKSLNLTSDEITAIMLHEIGHIILDSKLIEDIQLSYLEARSSIGVFKDNPDDANKSHMMRLLYCMSQLQSAQLNNSIKNMAIEENADRFAVRSGYGIELSKALSKFSNYYRVATKTISKSKMAKDRLDESKMFLEYSRSFDNRKIFIKDLVNLEYKQSIFAVTKTVMKDMLVMLNMKPDRKFLMSESISSILNLKPNITRKETDTIRVELEMVDEHSDKLYLIRKIHKHLSRIQEYCENVKDPRHVALYRGYEKELNGLLTTLLNKKIVDKQYGVFVKAPKGYQG